MSSFMGRTDGIIQKAVYQYNGLGHRMGQSIATGDEAPVQTRPISGMALLPEWKRKEKTTSTSRMT